MSYGLRNTIILVVVLLVLAGSSWGYVHYIQEKKIVSMQRVLRTKQQKLRNDKSIANKYDEVVNKYARKRFQLKKFNKTMPLMLSASSLYRYLNKVRSDRSDFDINYTYLKREVKKKKNYGIVRANLSGQGSYKDLYRLIRNIKLSSPIVKIHRMVVNPTFKNNNYNDVNFTFEIDGYYSKSQNGNNIPTKIVKDYPPFIKNPFFPLIRNVKPNTMDLTNVEQSKLVGIGKGVIYIIDQHGKVRILHTGDKVYLGKFVSSSVNNRTATFQLNKGGLWDKVVMKLNTPENNKNQ